MPKKLNKALLGAGLLIVLGVSMLLLVAPFGGTSAFQQIFGSWPWIVGNGNQNQTIIPEDLSFKMSLVAVRPDGSNVTIFEKSSLPAGLRSN